MTFVIVKATLIARRQKESRRRKPASRGKDVLCIHAVAVDSEDWNMKGESRVPDENAF
jgi:hypothetical protein